MLICLLASGRQFITIPLGWVAKWFFKSVPNLRLKVEVPPPARPVGGEGAGRPNSWAGLGWRASRRRRRDVWRYQLTQPQCRPAPTRTPPILLRPTVSEVGPRAGLRAAGPGGGFGGCRPAQRSAGRVRLGAAAAAAAAQGPRHHPERDQSDSGPPRRSLRWGDGSGWAGFGWAALFPASLDFNLVGIREVWLRRDCLVRRRLISYSFAILTCSTGTCTPGVEGPWEGQKGPWWVTGGSNAGTGPWVMVWRAGDAHLRVCGKDCAPADSGFSLVSCTGLQETPYWLTKSRFWTKGGGALETLFTPQAWCVCILIGACWVYTMEEYVSAETSFDQRRVKGSWFSLCRIVPLPLLLVLVLTDAS